MVQSKFSVVKQPYDATLEENMSMYDKLPYKRNIDMCNASTLALISGNLVKFYRCTYDEPREIDTQDSKFDAIVSAHIRKYEKDILTLKKKFPSIYGSLEEDTTEEGSEQEHNADISEE